MSDPQPPSDAPPPSSREKKRDEAAEDGRKSKPAGLDYVFKIVRADPKNAFDFEDVADK
jgi:hypothetical protein